MSRSQALPALPSQPSVPQRDSISPTTTSSILNRQARRIGPPRSSFPASSFQRSLLNAVSARLLGSSPQLTSSRTTAPKLAEGQKSPRSSTSPRTAHSIPGMQLAPADDLTRVHGEGRGGSVCEVQVRRLELRACLDSSWDPVSFRWKKIVLVIQALRCSIEELGRRGPGHTRERGCEACDEEDWVATSTPFFSPDLCSTLSDTPMPQSIPFRSDEVIQEERGRRRGVRIRSDVPLPLPL